MSDMAAGERIVVRDEEWLVRAVRNTEHDGVRVEVTGVSPLVRDQDAVFFGSLDTIDRLDPKDGKLVADDSAGFRRSRLWLESVRRSSPVPASETRITVGHRGLLDRMDYQLRPAAQALQNLRPRILIGDAVGLGKTLEIGILLSELIRRGRGERILVVTPRAVLEQFQRELWTRFAIPLIRLDSGGIQKVRQTLPSSRNPFSYYKRVIVSIDTLKNPARYKHHLKSQKWDAVVIDECHNLINRGTQNNELAKLLAKQTDALLLASATPHNGKPESFAELVHLLDPTAIVDRTDYSAKDIEHLYVRRHRNSPDVKLDVAHKWKERHQPKVIEVAPSPAEADVLRELESTWLYPDGPSVVTGQGKQLFPWTLFKAFLSSPKALQSSIARRLATIGDPSAPESKALRRLDELAQKSDVGLLPNSPSSSSISSTSVSARTRKPEWWSSLSGSTPCCGFSRSFRSGSSCQRVASVLCMRHFPTRRSKRSSRGSANPLPTCGCYSPPTWHRRDSTSIRNATNWSTMTCHGRSSAFSNATAASIGTDNCTRRRSLRSHSPARTA